MNHSNFDELTKALANSTSRRHALRVIVTTSIGGLLGLTSIGTAFARHHRESRSKPPGGQPSNKFCAHWCAAVFGANTPAASQCTSDAAHGKGLCQQCSNTDPSQICCVRNPNGFCNGSVAGATCCPTGQHCESGSGTCVPNCLDLGETCSQPSDCCSGGCARPVSTAPVVCCTPQGQPCSAVCCTGCCLNGLCDSC